MKDIIEVLREFAKKRKIGENIDRYRDATTDMEREIKQLKKQNELLMIILSCYCKRARIKEEAPDVDKIATDGDVDEEIADKSSETD